MRLIGVPHRLMLAVALSLAPASTTLARSVTRLDRDIDRVVQLLIEHGDDKSVTNAAAWAERRVGVRALADAFREATRSRPDARSLSTLARLYELAGCAAFAFDAYERAASLADADSATRLRYLEMCVAAGWRERARDFWQRSPELSLPAVRRVEITYQLASDHEAREYLREQTSISAQRRAGFAKARGDFTLASELFALAEAWPEAIDNALAAGDVSRARDIAGRHPEALTIDAAMVLGRWFGDRSLLDRVLGERDDAEARALRARLAASFGATPVRHTGDGAAPPDRPSGGDAEPHSVVPPVPPPPSTLTSDPSQTSEARARQLAGTTAVTRATLDALVAELHRQPPTPSLWYVIALGRHGERDAARRQLARWRLQPRETERTRLLERALAVVHPAPSLDDSDLRSPRVVLDLLRANEPSRAQHAVALSAIARAITAAQPGSELEAELLFERALWTESTRDLQRARRIAPDLLVSRTRVIGEHRYRITLRLGAVREFDADALYGVFQDTVLPPGDVVVGFVGDSPRSLSPAHALRVSSAPPNDALADWRLIDWRDEADALLATLERIRERARRRALPAEVAPLDGTIEFADGRALAIGCGCAAFDADGRSVFSVTSLDGTRAIATAAAPFDADWMQLVPRSTRNALARISTPPRGPFPPAVLDFARGAARRRGQAFDAEAPAIDQSLAVDGEWIVRCGTVRGRFARRSPTVDVPSPATPEAFVTGADFVTDREGFEDVGDGIWVARSLQPLPSRATPATIGRGGAFVRRWAEPTSRTTQDSPEPVLVFPQRPSAQAWRLPARAGAPLSRADRTDLSAELTDAGWLVVYGRDACPRWMTRIAPPLPGPGGFAHLPPSWTRERERGLHRAGPIASVGRPRLFLAGSRLFVVTDRVVAFDRIETEHPLCERFAAVFDEAIRDLVVDASGTPCLIVGDRIASLDASATLAPHAAIHTGTFDIEFTRDPAGETLWQLSWSGSELRLAGVAWRQGTEVGDAMTIPLPTLTIASDRVGRRITSLATDGTSLYLLHDALYQLRDRATWTRVIAWPGYDAAHTAHYLQPRPIIDDRDVIIARPWGIVEGWEWTP